MTEEIMTTLRKPIDDGDEDVRRILGKLGVSVKDLFDHSDEGGDIYADRLRSGLSAEEIEEAMLLKRLLRGVALVTGAPGSGKGLFGNVVPWLLKRYFEGRKVLLDYKPKPAYGLYLPFDEEFLDEELRKTANLSRVKPIKVDEEIDREDTNKLKVVKKLARDWVRSEEAEVYLKKSLLVLEEFKRYVYNRRPMNPFGITLGYIMNWWRHFDMLILGMTPFKNEIDKKECLQYVTHEVRCTWGRDGRAWCNVYSSNWVSARGVLQIEKHPTCFRIDGEKERPELGVRYTGEDGTIHYNRYYDLYNSKYLPSTKV